MIEKSKIYLCVGTYVKTQEEIEKEKLRNQFIDTYYYSVSNGYCMTRDGSVFIPSFAEWRPEPIFYIGQYYTSQADGYLTDALSNQIEITEENYHNFVEFNYEITAEAQRRIDIMREKGVVVSITPVAVMRENVIKSTSAYSLNDFVIKWNVCMTLLKLGDRSIYATAIVNEVETQEDGILKAWKKLRLHSSLACRIKNSVIKPKGAYFGAFDVNRTVFYNYQ